MFEALVYEANSWKSAHQYLHPSMHHLGPCLLQRLLSEDWSKTSGPGCYYFLLKSCDHYEQKQTLRDFCSSTVGRYSADKRGWSHSEGQVHPTSQSHKILT